MGRLLTGMMVAIATLTVFSVGLAYAESARLVGDGAEIVDTSGEVRMTLELSRAVPWKVSMADEPPRLVLELLDTELQDDVRIRTSSIGAVTVVPTAVDKLEVNAVLREPLTIRLAEMRTDEDGRAILEVILQPATAQSFETAMEDPDVGSDAERTVIAIDPGHGGRDPGAQVDGMREADLVLGFAFRLRDALLASGRFDVVLTRETDDFVSLDERLTRARDAGADVLISLHADTLEDAGAASGIVIYRLGDDASAAADERLTERHAPDDRLSGVDMTGAGDDVSLALLTLARQEAAPRSRDLSAKLVVGFQSAELALNTRPERIGAFTVLKAADIPSVLIELGFLSTEEDLQRLTSAEWQLETAAAMRDALLLWADEDALR